MAILKYCSSCGKKNRFDKIEGFKRYHCVQCNDIHYQNPKPTATLVCVKNNNILLVRRAFEPEKGKWSLPGGFIELGETPEDAAIRELKEETNLNGVPVQLIGHCSHFNTLFGDVLLLGIEMKINRWLGMKAGDDASEVKLFHKDTIPKLAFNCHQRIVDKYFKSN